MALTATLGTSAGGSGTSATVPLNITDAANQTLFVGVALDFTSSAYATPVTYNGVSMTLVAETTDLSPYLSVWKLTNPDSGSSFDIVTPVNENRPWRVIAVIANDNDQTTPNDSPGTNYENASTTSTTKTTASAAGDLVLSFGGVDNKTVGGTSEAGSGQTLLAEINGDGAVYLGASYTAGGASIGTSWSWSGSAAAAEIAFNINVAAAGGRATKNTRAFPLGVNVGMGFGMGGA